jgi:ABC-2 type transport system ATP-binding protein
VREEIGVVLDESGFPDCLTAAQIGRVMAGIYRGWDAAYYDGMLKKLSLPTDKKYKEYSRGMKMKQAIAVALSHHPKLLVLDEATSGLDPVVRDEVVEIFSEFTRDEEHSVLISSHIVSDLEKICDYIAFLHRGKLLLCEEKDALREEYGLVHLSKTDFAALDESAVIGSRSTPYGVSAVVHRDAVPAWLAVEPVSIEDLFILMVKEGER